MKLRMEKSMQKNAYKFFLFEKILYVGDFKLATAIYEEARFRI